MVKKKHLVLKTGSSNVRVVANTTTPCILVVKEEEGKLLVDIWLDKMLASIINRGCISVTARAMNRLNKK